MIHQAGQGYEFIPVEVDFELVRRTRRRGLMGLGQVLKSFRDTEVSFPPYAPGAHRAGAFANLGPLERPAGRARKS